MPIFPFCPVLGGISRTIADPFDKNGAKKTINGLQRPPRGSHRKTGGFTFMLSAFKFVSIVAATAYSTAALAGPFDGIYLQNENADAG
jgi:hypothetical protein